MFLSTVKTRKLCEGRNSWHSRWWEFKAVLLLLSMAVPFFIPSQFVQIYGWSLISLPLNSYNFHVVKKVRLTKKIYL